MRRERRGGRLCVPIDWINLRTSLSGCRPLHSLPVFPSNPFVVLLNTKLFLVFSFFASFFSQRARDANQPDGKRGRKNDRSNTFVLTAAAAATRFTAAAAAATTSAAADWPFNPLSHVCCEVGRRGKHTVHIFVHKNGRRRRRVSINTGCKGHIDKTRHSHCDLSSSFTLRPCPFYSWLFFFFFLFARAYFSARQRANN